MKRPSAPCPVCGHVSVVYQRCPICQAFPRMKIAASQYSSREEFWADCKRVDWLLWWMVEVWWVFEDRSIADRKTCIRCAVLCVETLLPRIQDEHDQALLEALLQNYYAYAEGVGELEWFPQELRAIFHPERASIRVAEMMDIPAKFLLVVLEEIFKEVHLHGVPHQILCDILRGHYPEVPPLLPVAFFDRLP